MRNDQVLQLIKERVARGDTATLIVTGNSMAPLFKSGVTTVELRLPKRIKKYDIVLYQRKDGTVVLHRVVGIKGNLLSCRGDNEIVTEKGVSLSSVAAVAVASETNGKRKNLQGAKSRLYGSMRGLRRSFYRIFGGK